MSANIKAGFLYALGVFLVGFALGTLRVLLLAPRLGVTAATLLEAPIMLLVSWMISSGCATRFQVPRRAPDRLVMGTTAFVVLVMLEFGVSMAIFRRSAAEFLVGYRSLPGMIGLAAQLCFAIIPLAQTSRRHPH